MTKEDCPLCGHETTSKINPKEGFATILCKNCGCLIIYGTFTALDKITHYRFVPKENYDKSHKLKKMVDNNPFICLKQGK